MFQEHGEEAYLKQFGRSLPKAQLEMLKDVRRSKFKATTLQITSYKKRPCKAP
jgi:hypothetical protein